MDSPFLEREEIIGLTGKQRYTAQRKVLNALGITHKTRPDGSLLILWEHVTKVLGGEVARESKLVKQPNWDAMKTW